MLHDRLNMAPHIHSELLSWSMPIGLTLVLMVVALVYWRGWYQLRNALPRLVSGWRLAAFMSGLLSLWVAVASPLAMMDHQLLTVHMTQHLLLMTVAAPLVLLGAPVIALLQSLPQRLRHSVIARLLRWLPVHSVGRIITQPAFCWLASTVTVIGWHVPTLFQLGMHSQGWHGVEHTSFFVAGLLFWWPVVRPWPSLTRLSQWSVPLYLFLATVPCDALSAFLTFCNRVVYPHYLSAHRHFNISALGDQERAGALMWVWVTFVYLVPAAAVTIQMLSPHRRASEVKVG
jgi:putative membrane protein